MFTDLHEPKFWVLVAFVLFALILLYNRVPSMIGKMLDQRAHAIKKELDEARRLREEAQALLADYQKKAREAENEAKSIIEQAQREAEAMAADTQRSLKESLERRTKMAEDKIARAEAQALSEVRATAVDTAIAAAEQLLQGRAAGAEAASLIDQSIRELKGKLN